MEKKQAVLAAKPVQKKHGPKVPHPDKFFRLDQRATIVDKRKPKEMQ